MKVVRLNFYAHGRIDCQAEQNGQYCRISDLPKEVQDAYFEPIPSRDFGSDNDDDDADA